jgi:hypothetical protein
LTSNGMLMPALDSAVMLVKPAMPVGVTHASAPPVAIASQRPHAMSRAAYPMECVDAAHAVTTVSFGPCSP